MDVYIWQVKCKYMSYGDGFVDPAKLKVEPEAKTDDFKTLKGNVTLLR